MYKAYQYRLYPTQKQEQLLLKHFDCSRFIYNYMLDKRIKEYKTTGKFISKYDLCRMLTELKKEKDYEWLTEVSAQSLQQSIFNLDKAFTMFFRQKCKFPNFKSKKRQQCYHLATKTYAKFEDKASIIPKLGKVKTRFDRQFNGKIKHCAIKMTNTHKFFISFIVDEHINAVKAKDISKSKALGLDLGLKSLLTLSDGRKFDNIRPYKQLEDKIKRKQRKLSKKQKNSKNREKARLQLAKLYEKAQNKRNDYLHKITTQLVNESQIDVFCVEDLAIKSMMKNHKLAKSIADAGWHKLISMLETKANNVGKHVLKIGRFEPSSKLCTCGTINHKLSLKDRQWTCEVCGKTHDRDILAASNIKDFAFSNQNLIDYSYKDYAGKSKPGDA